MLEEISGAGVLLPLLIIFFTQVPCFKFLQKNVKNENRICPLPYEEILEDIIWTVWAEQCGNLQEMRYLGKAALVYPG